MFSPDLALVVCLYAVFAVMVTATAAHDSAIALAIVTATGGLDMRTAQVLVAVLMAVGAALAIAPVSAGVLGPMAELPAFRHSAYPALAVFVPAALVMAGATALGLPVAPSGVLGVAMVGVLVDRGGAPPWPVGLLVGGALLAPLLCFGLARLLERGLRAGPAASPRPRDRLSPLLPLEIGLVLALMVLLAGLFGGVRLTDPLPAAVVAAVALLAGAGGFAWRHAAIRRNPFWVTNDLAGFETAHAGPSLLVALAMALLLAGIDVSAVIVLMVGLLGNDGAATLSTGPWAAGLGLTVVGVMLFGHHVAGRIATRVPAAEPSHCVAGGCGLMLGSFLVGLAGAPLGAAASAAASLSGATGSGRNLVTWSIAWVLSLASSFGAAYLTSLALRALVE